MKDYIAEALKNGVSPEDLIEEFAEKVADAQIKQTENTEKIKDTKEVINTIGNYIAKYYPDANIAEKLDNLTTEDAEEIIEIFDGYINLIGVLSGNPGKIKFSWNTNPIDKKDKSTSNELISNLYKSFFGK